VSEQQLEYIVVCKLANRSFVRLTELAVEAYKQPSKVYKLKTTTRNSSKPFIL